MKLEIGFIESETASSSHQCQLSLNWFVQEIRFVGGSS